MSQDTKQYLRQACRFLLRPVTRILLRGGITWKEFVELAKLTFVEVAGEDYGINGRPTNASRVALLTGLSRREVARVRDLLAAEGDDSDTPQSRISRILSAWHQDPQFLDAQGLPRELIMEGNPASMAELLRLYAGDFPAVAIIKELTRLNLIEETGDGGFRVLRRSYTGTPMDPDILRQMSQALHDHGQTLAWNIDDERSGEPYFERMAFNSNMPKESIEEFHRLVAEHGQAFLERMDTWLSEHEREKPGRTSKGRARLGVGVYFINDEIRRGSGK